MTDFSPGSSNLLNRLDGLVDRLEAIFGPSGQPNIEDGAIAHRWVVQSSQRGLIPVWDTHKIRVEDLHGIDRQIEVVDANTRQFVQGHPRNHVLMWGSRGTGKSSLVKAMLNRYSGEGLRLIEIDAHDLIDLPGVVALLRGRAERYVLFVDDLSFDADDASYRTLKAALDGSISTPPDNVVIYATSNRRHLVPEKMVDNEQSRLVEGELHHGEAVEEKISLSERFGVWLSFHPFSQDQYLTAVKHWLTQYGVAEFSKECRAEALRWALLRGNRSGRIAAQFAMDFAGKRLLGKS